MAQGYTFSVAEVAAWLRQAGARRWWTVDGDASLAAALNLPCTGDDLAEALLAHGGQLRVFAPGDVALLPSGRPDVGSLAEVDAGARVFELAWVEAAGVGEPWVLAEDTVAQAASDGISAHV